MKSKITLFILFFTAVASAKRPTVTLVNQLEQPVVVTFSLYDKKMRVLGTMPTTRTLSEGESVLTLQPGQETTIKQTDKSATAVLFSASFYTGPDAHDELYFTPPSDEALIPHTPERVGRVTIKRTVAKHESAFNSASLQFDAESGLYATRWQERQPKTVLRMNADRPKLDRDLTIYIQESGYHDHLAFIAQ